MFGNMKKIHLVGIGGIGMSGIAELLKNQGFIISGSDLRSSSITDHLKKMQIRINIGHDPQNVIDADVIVKSSAVSDENPEIISALQRKIPVIRRAEMLAEIMRMIQSEAEQEPEATADPEVEALEKQIEAMLGRKV